jgi:uncharacterized protein YwqG
VARLTDELKQAGLGAHINEILELARVSARIERTRCEQSELARGASRLGGTADLPAGFAWPVFEERPLAFIAQFDLAALPRTVRELPSAGTLAFFYDDETMRWGFDPKDVGSAHVAYFPAGTVLIPTPTPEPARTFHPCAVTLARTVDLPSLNDLVCQPLREKLKQSERAAYEKLVASNDETYHHLLGHPQLVQNDMRVQCELVSHGFNTGSPEGYQAGKAFAEGGINWTLLLQIDTDDEDDGPGWMWGDVGRIYFWLTRQDLEAQRFDRSWLCLQCY